MSRSRRKTPISGITTCKSEKEDKRTARRVLRGANHRILQKIKVMYDSNIQDEVFEIPEFKLIREVSSIWSFGKDGKMRFSSWRLQDPTTYARLMRK